MSLCKNQLRLLLTLPVGMHAHRKYRLLFMIAASYSCLSPFRNFYRAHPSHRENKLLHKPRASKNTNRYELISDINQKKTIGVYIWSCLRSQSSAESLSRVKSRVTRAEHTWKLEYAANWLSKLAASGKLDLEHLHVWAVTFGSESACFGVSEDIDQLYLSLPL
jgi:hypothetical protein